MNTALQAVVEYLEVNKFPWQTNTEESYVESQFYSQQGQWRCVLQPFEDPDIHFAEAQSASQTIPG